MSHTLRRILPIAALCVATLLGGCVVYPAPGYYGHAYHDHGYRGGWYR